jgi:hypothetical protein
VHAARRFAPGGLSPRGNRDSVRQHTTGDPDAHRSKITVPSPPTDGSLPSGSPVCDPLQTQSVPGTFVNVESRTDEHAQGTRFKAAGLEPSALIVDR